MSLKSITENTILNILPEDAKRDLVKKMLGEPYKTIILQSYGESRIMWIRADNRYYTEDPRYVLALYFGPVYNKHKCNEHDEDDTFDSHGCDFDWLYRDTTNIYLNKDTLRAFNSERDRFREQNISHMFEKPHVPVLSFDIVNRLCITCEILKRFNS